MRRLAHVAVVETGNRRDARVESPESGVYGIVRKQEPVSEFAAHDAKNMLTVLTGNLVWLHEALARDATRAELDDVVTDLDTCVRRLTDLMRQMTPHNEKPPSALTPQLAPVNVSHLLFAVYRQVQRQAAARGVTIDVRILADTEAKLDRDLIERVLVNLVDNALRFAPPRSTVRIACDVVDERVELTVSDEGPGVDKAHSERIFEPYFTTATGAFPGETMNSGLGLAFCRAVARAHGGDVRAEGGAGGGCFVVELPSLSSM